MKYTKGDLYNFLEKEANNEIKDFFEKNKKKYSQHQISEIDHLRWEEDCEIEKDEATVLNFVIQLPVVIENNSFEINFLNFYFEIRATIDKGYVTQNKKLARGNILVAATKKDWVAPVFKPSADVVKRFYEAEAEWRKERDRGNDSFCE